MPTKAKAAKPASGAVPMKEQIFYYVGGLGSGMIYSLMSSYIADFYMNVMKLHWLFVFLLMLIARIFNAVSDPVMGVLMDRMEPKRGKMRSWLYTMAWPAAIFTLLMFWAPEAAPTTKMVYAAVTFVLWGLAFTGMDIPFWSLPMAMAPNEKERGTVFSLGRAVNGVGAALPIAMYSLFGAVLPNRYPGTWEANRFVIMAVICAAVGGSLVFLTPFKVKERVPLPKPKEGESALRHVLKCKPLVLTVLMGILSGGRYMYQAGAAHVARYSISLNKSADGLSPADIEKGIASAQMIMQIALAVGMMGAMLVVPILQSRFSYKQMLVGSSLVGGAAGIVMYIIGYENFWAMLPLLFLSAIPLGIINSVAFAMVGDSLDYMEWGTGFRANGLGLACQSFVLKFGNALATAAIVLIYPLVKLDPSASQLVGAEATSANIWGVPAAQQASVRGGFFSIISIVPAISLLLSIIPILFYDLTGEKKATVTRELAERREKAKELAAELEA